jgi:hypothetical protein
MKDSTTGPSAAKTGFGQRAGSCGRCPPRAGCTDRKRDHASAAVWAKLGCGGAVDPAEGRKFSHV